MSARDGIAWGATSLLVHPTVLARDSNKWMSVLRCSCGRAWAEASWSSGHVEIFYVFPVPVDVDPVQWLATADSLPYDMNGPQGAA